MHRWLWTAVSVGVAPWHAVARVTESHIKVHQVGIAILIFLHKNNLTCVVQWRFRLLGILLCCRSLMLREGEVLRVVHLLRLTQSVVVVVWMCRVQIPTLAWGKWLEVVIYHGLTIFDIAIIVVVIWLEWAVQTFFLLYIILANFLNW